MKKLFGNYVIVTGILMIILGCMFMLYMFFNLENFLTGVLLIFSAIPVLMFGLVDNEVIE